MSPAVLPESVQVTEAPDGLVLQLPPRDRRLFRMFGALLLLLGLVNAVVVVGLLWFGGWRGGADEWIIVVAVAIGVPFLLLMAAGSFFFTPAAAHSASRITIDAFSIATEDTLAWFRRRQVIPRAHVRSVVVEPFFQQKSGRSRRNGFLGSLAQLRVLLETGASKVIAPAYARDLLAPVAEELARQCATPGAAEPVAVAHFDEKLGPYERIPFRLNRPRNSRVELQEHPDGLTFVLPPVGFRRGTRTLLVSALIWLSLSVLAACAVLFAGGPQGPLEPALAIVLSLVLIGIALLVASIAMARRRAVIAVVGDRLLVMLSGLFGSKRREWDRSELRDVRLGASGMVDHKSPVLQLQIVPQKGKRYGMLTGRDEPELDWIAALLRRTLRLNGAASTKTPAPEHA
jgi:hypothetical protein